MPDSSPPRTIHTVTDLTPDSQNANRGTSRGQSLLADSLRTYGAGRSVLADRNGVVVAGNKTVHEAQKLGLPVQVVQTDGNSLVVVQRTDLTLGEDERARQLAYADNRIAELNLDWDPALLRQQLADGLDLNKLWTPGELELFFGEGLGRGNTDEDAVVPMRDTAIQRGDLFELGAHRLLCGDATVEADVGTVCAGDVPVLMVADPPYGVDYDAGWRVRARPGGRHAVGKVLNDDRADWSEAIARFGGAVAYIWHAGVHAGTVADALTRNGFAIRAQIIWTKSSFVLGRGDYHWGHEPCWYAVRAGQASRWRGVRTQSTVWPVPNLNPVTGERGGDNAVTGHSTQKPVRLFELPMLHHTTPGEVVYDPFVGSGTAIIAAEKTGRRCRAIELEPRYVQAAIDRWEAFTGQRAQRHETPARP